MRHSLYKYYSEHRWAKAFLDGQILFRPLSYFRDYGDKNIRGDQNEGTSVFRPEDGLVINNKTLGTTFTLPHSTFLSSAQQEDILIFCASKSHSEKHYESFEAIICVEILDIKALCQRIKAVLPLGATFYGQRVEYYRETESGSPRWALPKKIATSKLAQYAWQDEYRLLLCFTEALKFEKVALRIVQGNAAEIPKPTQHHKYLMRTSSLRDICQLHEL